MASTGIVLRRNTKNVLTTIPPVAGEIVFATDTGEHGWLDNLGVLNWKTLNEKVSKYTFHKKIKPDVSGSFPQNTVGTFTKPDGEFQINLKMIISPDDQTKNSTSCEGTAIIPTNHNTTTNNIEIQVGQILVTYTMDALLVTISIKSIDGIQFCDMLVSVSSSNSGLVKRFG